MEIYGKIFVSVRVIEPPYSLKLWISQGSSCCLIFRTWPGKQFFLSNRFQKPRGAAVSFSKFSVCLCRIIWSANFSRRIRIPMNASDITRWPRRRGEPRNRVCGTKFEKLSALKVSCILAHFTRTVHFTSFPYLSFYRYFQRSIEFCFAFFFQINREINSSLSFINNRGENKRVPTLLTNEIFLIRFILIFLK